MFDSITNMDRYVFVFYNETAPTVEKKVAHSVIARFKTSIDPEGFRFFEYFRDLCLKVLKVTHSSLDLNFLMQFIAAEDDRRILNYSHNIRNKSSIRVMYVGHKNDLVDQISIKKASHVAVFILEATDSSYIFRPTIVHPHPPCFYQAIANSEEASFYLQSIMLDAFMCHALSLCDFAYKLQEKQRLSQFKVHFLKSYVDSTVFETNISNSYLRVAIKAAVDKLDSTTPYVSFFSLFISNFSANDTLTPSVNYDTIVSAYIQIWSSFAQWYLVQTNRLIRSPYSPNDILSLRKSFGKYAGQISPKKLRDTIDILVSDDSVESSVYVMAILRNIPSQKKARAQAMSLLKKNVLRQGMWVIIPKSDLNKFYRVRWAFDFTCFHIHRSGRD